MKHLAFSCFYLSIGLGQTVAQPLPKAPTRDFLDSAMHVLPSLAGAHYRRETTYTRDSTSAVVRTYYLTGQFREQEVVDYPASQDYHARSESFDEAGHLLVRREASRKFLTELHYYPNGQLKRHEQHTYGLLGRKRGACFAPDSQRILYSEYETPPRYPRGDGSMQAALKDIKYQLQYPADALRARIEGRVFVAFTVSESGAIENAYVAKAVLPSLDAEAVRAVNQLPRFVPARLDGRARKAKLVLPIDFVLH